VTFLLLCVTRIPARADIGVVLNESLDTSVARITGSGHTAIYFSRICPESPVKLRLCRPGEQGSVMSNYTTLGENQPFEWNVVPLSVFVYGVEDPRDRPVFGTPEIKRLLEERYREKYLAELCPAGPCTTSGGAEWREMVGAGLSRSMYIFAVGTTLEQDRALIDEFNALPNVNHFNPITRNCANFAKSVLDHYFPGAAHRELVNDFGMTSPKAIARSFTLYAERHPEMHLHIFHFAQVPGTIKRSSECRDGTEQLYHSKKLLVPMVLLASRELPVFTAAYLLTGRFNPEHQWENHPALDEVAAPQVAALAYSGSGSSDIAANTAAANAELVGTSQQWDRYRRAFHEIAQDTPDHDSVNGFPKRLDKMGSPMIDADGSLWMKVPQDGRTVTVGLSASNVLASNSDPGLARDLMLARVNAVLKSPKHGRESLVEFEQDWALLQSFSARKAVTLSAASH